MNTTRPLPSPHPAATGAERLALAEQLDAALKAHYLALPGKTDGGWLAVKADPRRYNHVWRHFLRAHGHVLEVNHFPPPIHLQGVLA